MEQNLLLFRLVAPKGIWTLTTIIVMSQWTALIQTKIFLFLFYFVAVIEKCLVKLLLTISSSLTFVTFQMPFFALFHSRLKTAFSDFSRILSIN